MRVVELILRSGQFLSCLNSTRLMQPEFSFSCPQGPAACHCLEADKLIPRRHMLFKVYFNIILSYIYSFISIQPLGRFQQEPEPSQATGMALAHYILGKFLGVGCHCFPPPLDVPTFSARCIHVQRHDRPLAAEGGTLRGRQISSRIRLPRNSRDLLHAANLRHGTDVITSPPKEGVQRIFYP